MPVDVSGTYGLKFGAWVAEHYEIDRSLAVSVLRCRRCHAEVGYLTKHAAVRHGDDILIKPLHEGEREADYVF